MIDFKSDSLSQLRPFFDSLDDLNVWGTIHQFPIIVDSCVVLSDLIWLTKHREKTGARTSLQESVDAETLILYAPNELEKEVNSKLQKISNDEGISLQALKKAWNDYKKWIHLVKIESPTQSEIDTAQDPKDLPFKKLQDKTGYPIYTKDSDISAMGGKVVQRDTIDHSRDYSRSAAIEFSMKAFGLFSIASVFISFKIFRVSTKSILNLVKQAPGWLQFGGIMIVMLLLFNKKSRQHISSVTMKSATKIKIFNTQFVEFTAPIIDKFTESQEKSDTSLNLIKQKF